MRSHLPVLLTLACLAHGCTFAAGPGIAPAPPAAIVATIPAGNPPVLLAMAADGERLYAASNDGRLTVIDARAATLITTVKVSPYTSGIAVAPDGSRVYLANLFGGDLAVLDAQSNTMAPSIGLISRLRRGGYGRIAIAPDGSAAYIANTNGRTIVRLDLRTNELLPLNPDMFPEDLAMTPNGRRILIAGCRNYCVPGALLPLDPATGAFGTLVYSGTKPYRILISPDGTRAFMANLGDSTVTVIDSATLAENAKVRVPPSPTSLALTGDGKQLYAAGQDSGTLTVIDTGGNEVITSVRVGTNAREVAVTPDGRRAFVSTDDGVVVIDTAALGTD